MLIGSLSDVRRKPQLRGAFVPFDLGPALLGFWDADRGVTLTGGKVSAWRDEVAGYTATQAAAAARPIVSETGLNGRYAVEFDGVGTFLGMESVPFPVGAAGSEIWALVRQDDALTNGGTRVVLGYGGSSNQTARAVRRVSGVVGGVASLLSGNGTTTAAISPSGDSFIGHHVVRGVFTSAEYHITQNGTGMRVASAPAAPGLLTGSVRTRIGASVGAGLGSYWTGGMAVVAVTDLLSDVQAAAMTKYMLGRRTPYLPPI
jgi:hypothetical protein